MAALVENHKLERLIGQVLVDTAAGGLGWQVDSQGLEAKSVVAQVAVLVAEPCC